MGLFAGLSLLSIVELVYWVYVAVMRVLAVEDEPKKSKCS